MTLPDEFRIARLIVENVRSYAIIIVHADGAIRDWLGGAEAITGFSREEALGMAFDVLFTEPDRAAGMPAAELATARADGRAEDSRWHRRKDGKLFWGNGLTVALGEDNLFAKIFRDETPAKLAEEQRVLLLNELNHRVKNTLATVQSVAEQTLRSAGVDAGVRQDLTERFHALSRAHDVLVAQNWAGADLKTLICDTLAPYERDPSPLILRGPAVRLHPSQAIAISLTCHELATNAAKYGALKSADGRIEISWNLAHNGHGERYLTLLWNESGGPPVAPPVREGFGTRLIQRTFASQKGSRAEVEYHPLGVRWLMVLALVDEVDDAVGGSPADAPSHPEADQDRPASRPKSGG